MCRFVAYLGEPIIVDELLIKPENSLVNQSYDAEEMSETLNGDGFGLGWYARHIRPYPGLFRSVSPAWNNQNLRYNASLIQTDCLFAHIRAATEGSVTEMNCHPFHYEQFLMMHNGGIPEFRSIKRRLMAHLSDEAFLWIQGQTDSEHVFALLMDHFRRTREDRGRMLNAEEIADGFRSTFQLIEEWRAEAGTLGAPSTFNMLITDGERIFGTRYSSDPAIASPTLYFATGSNYQSEEGFSGDKTANRSALLVSEKLTDNVEFWRPVPENHFIAVEKDLRISVQAL